MTVEALHLKWTCDQVMDILVFTYSLGIKLVGFSLALVHPALCHSSDGAAFQSSRWTGERAKSLGLR